LFTGELIGSKGEKACIVARVSLALKGLKNLSRNHGFKIEKYEKVYN
jgi:hypothetical protein